MKRRLRRLIVLLLLTTGGIGASAQDFFSEGPRTPRPDGSFSIRGTVVDAATGAKLANATVKIQSAEAQSLPPFEAVTTGADGKFAFENLAEGKYSLFATAPGYAETEYLRHENFWSAIALGPGKDATQLRFPLQPAGVIVGQVTDEAGEAVRGATVRLWSRHMANGKVGIESVSAEPTNDLGRYRFGHLSAGEYSIGVQAALWYEAATTSLPGTTPNGSSPTVLCYPLMYYPNTTDSGGMGWISLVAGQTETADMQLTPVTAGTLLVMNDSATASERVAYVLEQALPDGSMHRLETQPIVAPGGIEFAKVPPGNYVLRDAARPNGSGPQSRQISIASGETQQTGELPVRPPMERAEFHVKLENQEPEMVRGLVMQIAEPEGGFQITGCSPVRGEEDMTEFTCPILSSLSGAGSYELSVQYPPGAKITALTGKGAKINATKFELDGTTALELRATVRLEAGQLTGVALREGKPEAGVMILLLPQHSEPGGVTEWRDQSDSDGTFLLRTVPPGKYKLLALERGWELAWKQEGVLAPYLPKAIEVEIKPQERKDVRVDVQ